MDKIIYPLLYYQLKEDAVLGILVGTEIQMVDKDIQSIKMALQGHLRKQYKKYDDYPLMDLSNTRMKVVKVKIRPTYITKGRTYPASTAVYVPVPVIYGESDEGGYGCLMPLLDYWFYYDDEKQFDALAQFFASGVLNTYPAEKIYKMLQYPEPQLDSIMLKVNYDRKFDWFSNSKPNRFKTLSKVAERFPHAKSKQKNATALPQAAWELSDKVSEVINQVSSFKANVLLIGKRGVGKSAVLNQAIRKISSAGKSDKNAHTFWRVMARRLVAGAKYFGEWQGICEDMIEELNVANGILWVEDVMQLLQTGGKGAEDSVASFFINFLQQHRLQIVGEATTMQLDSMRKLLPEFVQMFQLIHIEEMSAEKVRLVLGKFAEYSEEKMKVVIDHEAQDFAFRLLNRYYPYESFPGKGIKFLGQCVSEARMKNKGLVNKEGVVENFIKQTGLPELFLRDDLLLDQHDLDKYFRTRIIGQALASKKLTEVVKVFKAGLNNPDKPITSLVFAGPTGVGKTESAKALADYFFGKGQKKTPLVRLDMSEFKHPSQIYRLIGSGREVGQLVKGIRQRPFSVLLLDEVEKAHPAIFDVLLGVLDEGLLVDAYGRQTNFRNTIIIMTTNLGATNQKSIGFKSTTDSEANYISALEKHFRPEFLNRIDGMVLFNPLGKKDIRAIAEKELQALNKREGLKKRDLKIEYSERMLEHLVKNGFDEKYGARPLQRTIEEDVIAPVSYWLLSNRKVKGKVLKVDFEGETVVSEV